MSLTADLGRVGLSSLAARRHDRRVLRCHKLERLPNPLRNFPLRSAFGQPLATLCFQIFFVVWTFASKLLVLRRDLVFRLRIFGVLDLRQSVTEPDCRCRLSGSGPG